MSYILLKIKNHSGKKYILTLFLFSILLFFLMESSVFGLIKFHTSDMIDTLFFYSPTKFAEVVNSLDSFERTNYFRLHIIDYGFIIAFYPLLSILLYRGLYCNNLHRHLKWHKIAFIPLLAMIFDITENIIIDLHITFISEPNKILCTLSSVATILKFSIIVVSIVFIVYLTFKLISRKIKRT